MNKTRKAFIVAGSVIAIIASIFMLFTSAILFVASSIIDEKFVVETYYAMDPNATLVTEQDGGYIIYYRDSELNMDLTVTDEEVKTIVNVSSTLCLGVSITSLTFATAGVVLSIILLVEQKKHSAKGIIIALLVISALSGNLLSTAFMIVALCLKHKNVEVAQNANT